ncbi:hypothetical protein GCM10009789_60260 [Kribbella sancticallisti]|uniref:GerMN domain-containing protein n=1 Tax=Kribbella sancticallisti TaxID=460087 RepID=A0ABN2E9S5_9ACTN
MSEHPDDRFDELIRRALADEADKIESAGGLHEIQARVRDQRRPVSRRPWVLTAGAAAIGTAAAIGAFAMLNDTTKNADEPIVAGPADTASATPQPSAKASTAPPTAKTAPSVAPSASSTSSASAPKTRAIPEPTVKDKAVPVYWVGKTVGNETGAGIRLFRTYSRISGSPTLEAVRLLTSGRADDPDYYTLWQGAAVSSVTRADGVVTVDFKALPKNRLDSGTAAMAIQQLVYTVQGVLGDSGQKVLVTEQGRSGATLFGQTSTRDPFSRAQALDVQALVWINSPANEQVLRSPVKVSGQAAAFEAQVDWKATNLKTKQVVKGYTSTAEGQKFSQYAFTADLGPGQWQLEAYLSSGEDGSATNTDSKVIYVK